DGEVSWQSRHQHAYAAALAQLVQRGLAYPCGCSRREIADSRLGVASDGAAIYPGTCRHGLAPGRSARAMRLQVPAVGADGATICFEDRLLGRTCQQLASEVGDFVLRRADGFWAYQLAVVVDDAAQGVTHIVRGTDLLDSTARQIYLQRLLGLPTPRYLHVPVVMAENGEKLSKQTGAEALDLQRPLEQLMRAATFLDLRIAPATDLAEFWQRAIDAWRRRYLVP
ncbi:MAG: glutamate--tRNA ligase family protein, partial [Janthinobacterium lividum]